MNASAHGVWAEVKDLVEVGESQDAYVFYGHANDPAGFALPAMESSYLMTPDGQKITLNTNKVEGEWVPGYGWTGDFGVSPVVAYWPGIRSAKAGCKGCSEWESASWYY